MKKSNRNFYERESITDIHNEPSRQNYNNISININNLEIYGNLTLQELDYMFYNELETNEERFEVVMSKPKMKKPIRFAIRSFVVVIIFWIISNIIMYNLESIISVVFPDLYANDFYLMKSWLQYLINQFQLVCQVAGVILAFISLVGTILVRPFLSFKSGNKFCLILDNIGFYKIDLDTSRFYDNSLSELYFVRYAGLVLGKDLSNSIKSVSYYSSYSKSNSDKNYYVLDLPNDSITSSSLYDLELCRVDFDKGVYDDLVDYMNMTEDSGF